MKKGFTLIEITIAMLIIGVLLVPVVLFFNQTMKNYTLGRPNTKTVEVVTDAINEIETLLKQAESIGIAEVTSIGFVIPKNITGNPPILRKIIFSLDSDGFIQRTDDFGTKYTPYYNNPNTPISDVVIFELSFRYFDENNNLLPYSQPDRVRLVEIAIKGTPKQIPQGMSNPEFELKTMVKLRNKN